MCGIEGTTTTRGLPPALSRDELFERGLRRKDNVGETRARNINYSDEARLDMTCVFELFYYLINSINVI